MADAVVGFLLENLTRIFSQEVNLLLGVENEVQLLQDDLNLIHLYLKGFDGRDKEDAIAKEYVNQIRVLVHKAEDVVDAYVAQNVQHRENLWWKMKAFFKIPTWHETAEQITSIRSRLNAIYQRREEFGGASVQARELWGEEHALSQRRRDPFEEVDMVGFDKEVDTITKQLTGGRPRAEVITIVGMSGLGKTTLASRVYNDPAIASHFSVRAWVYVSQRYSRRDLLETIIKDIMNLPDENVKAMSNNELNSKIQRYLRSSRYLVVLDDVWQPEFWKDVSKLFTGNLYGSRIILTTQLNDVASSIPNNTSLPLRFLTEEESWELLSNRVFHERQCGRQLGKLGFEIAKKCKGLPLAILVIAGVLKRQETTAWWSRVSSSVSTYITDRRERCSEILELSYNHLPVHLRQCFLYFGLFPEDHEILARLLICLWIAEGFIPKKEMRTEEEVAEEYMNELIARNLVQVAKRRSDGTVKSCRIHDLLRGFCISKAKDEQYLEIRGYVDSSSACSSRRLALHSKTLHYINSNRSSSNLRSLLMFGRDDDRVEMEHWKYLYKGYLLLRVLELGGVVVDSIPSEIEKLICLRYLRFKSNTIRTLPTSICNLWNLQTLEIIAPLINKPEINIWKMRQLRHLYFNGDILLPQPPKKMIRDQHDYHNNLQTLSSINPDCCTEIILAEVPNLVKLGIYGDLKKLKDKAFKSLSRLESLRKLKLTRDLRYDNLTRLPSIELLANIKKLTLSRTGLLEDPMKQLQKLPNLQVLKLKHDAYAGSRLECTEGEFPQLEVLKLIDLSIIEWDVSAELVPSLRSVFINHCGTLIDLPSSLADISTLQELQLSWPNASVARRAAEIKVLKKEKQERFKLVVINQADPNADNMQ